ncbi:MAG: LysM peptidoglycan-binding domain-containing protein [Pelagimonas sp.]|jgi:nucleoid-associated protein YgaU|nr:LysM peptidoglycan-binding domain-containing protein [Pelagimonas sp.]
MIRYIVLGFGFVSATAALLYGLGGFNEPEPRVDQVSRATPTHLGLTPATDVVQPAAPQYTSPNANVAVVPAALEQPTAEIAPRTQPLGVVLNGETLTTPTATPSEPTITATAPAAPDPVQQDEVMDVVHMMSMGIVRELNKPAPAGQQRASLAGVTQPVAAPVAEPLPEPSGRTYIVQEGDSLPGISFRHYGTTSAYIQILQANPDVISSPSEMQAGMVLRIPDLP